MNGWIERGEIARVADNIDRSLDPANNLLEQAGLPITFFRLDPQFPQSVLSVLPPDIDMFPLEKLNSEELSRMSWPW